MWFIFCVWVCWWIVVAVTHLLKCTSRSPSGVFGSYQTSYLGAGVEPTCLCMLPRNIKQDYNQICDLTKGNAYMLLSVNKKCSEQQMHCVVDKVGNQKQTLRSVIGNRQAGLERVNTENQAAGKSAVVSQIKKKCCRLVARNGYKQQVGRNYLKRYCTLLH